jgi:transcription elongation factor
MPNDDIKDIVEQLQRLQLRQDALIARLGELSGNNTGTAAPTRTTRIPTEAETIPARTVAIGDRVRIRNPGRFQSNKGVVITITKSRITVQAVNGSKIVRAPHNIFFDDE